MRALLAALIFLPLVTIQTGDATAKSQVTTETNGGTVETHITTNVNGNVTTTDSNQSGRIEVIATSGGTSIHTTPADILTSPTNIATPTPSVEQPIFIAMKTFISQTWQAFLQKIFSFFSVHP